MTNNSIQSLVLPHIAQLTPYSSARKIGGQGIWLNANEYAKTPDCLDGVNANDKLFDNLNRYPSPQPEFVIDAYAQYAKVQAKNVLMTRGGDEGIELMIRTFARPSDNSGQNDTVLYCPPTYGMYEVNSQTLGVSTLQIPQINDSKGFRLDLSAIEQALDNGCIKVIFVCNPNNPTGSLIDRADLIRLLQLSEHRAVVVIDEAYIEFDIKSTMAEYIDTYPHLAVIRTLSKAFGLAGIRAGFVLANEALIAMLAKVIAPYPIATPTAMIANLALSPKQVLLMQNRVKAIQKSRAKLIANLQALPIVTDIYPTFANFVLVKMSDGQAVFDYLWHQGVIVRNQSHATQLKDCLRISVGDDNENDTLIELLTKFNIAYKEV